MKLPSQESLLDLTCTYCVANNVDPGSLAAMTFAEVSLALVRCAANNPELMAANAEIHKYYQFCHVDCHMKRLRQFQRDGFQWLDGTGPHQRVPEGVTIN